jgi:hypothetical protein
MNQRGIVIRQDEKAIHQLAKRQNMEVLAQEGYGLPWPRTLFLDPSIHVPWGLLNAGMDFLDNWEAAAPVWSYETLIADVATGTERRITEALIGDLRVPMYATELLFVRDGEGGRALLAAWQEEIVAVPGGDARVAFSRALYRVKPLFVQLPRSWLTTAKEAKPQRPVAPQATQAATSAPERPRRPTSALRNDLVRVEVAPGRWVRCVPGNEDKVKAEWIEAHTPRRLRRGRRG